MQMNKKSWTTPISLKKDSSKPNEENEEGRGLSFDFPLAAQGFHGTPGDGRL